MRWRFPGRAYPLFWGLLVLSTLVPTVGWSQTSDNTLQALEKRLADKREAVAAHRQQMERLKDPDRLQVAMLQHFQMTEDLVALLLERHKLFMAQTSTSSASPGQGRGASSRSMQGGGTGGCCMQGCRMPGSMRPQTIGEMARSGMPGQPAPVAQAGTGTGSSEREQLMQRIAKHAAYMETIQDKTLLAQEMLRHHKLLDQMLQLIQ